MFFIKNFLYLRVFSHSPRNRITEKFKTLDMYYDMSYGNYPVANNIQERSVYHTSLVFVIFLLQYGLYH